MQVAIKVSPGMGRGVYYIDDTTLAKPGALLFKCEILALDPISTFLVNLTCLKHYTFKLDNYRDCLVLGHGELFNHSDTPNVEYELTTLLDGRKVMQFRLLSRVTSGDQLFINYNQDVNVEVAEYIQNKSLIG